jgi:hypothetical protein
MFEFLKKLHHKSEEAEEVKAADVKEEEFETLKSAAPSAEQKSEESSITGSSVEINLNDLHSSVPAIMADLILGYNSTLNKAAENLRTTKRYVEGHGKANPPVSTFCEVDYNFLKQPPIQEIGSNALSASNIGGAVATTSDNIFRDLKLIKDSLLVAKSVMLRMSK